MKEVKEANNPKPEEKPDPIEEKATAKAQGVVKKLIEDGVIKEDEADVIV